jgi:hypothetical protein
MLEIVKAQLKQANDICKYAKDRAASGYQFEDEFSRMLLSQKQTNFALTNDLSDRDVLNLWFKTTDKQMAQLLKLTVDSAHYDYLTDKD